MPRKQGGQAGIPKVLIDAFEILAGTPSGVSKLRELILDLAIKGKLVPQDPADEPASLLLKRISIEQKRLVEAKLIRKPKDLLPIEDDVALSAPLGWVMVKLGQLMEMYNGRAFKSQEWSTEGLPIVRIQNLNNPKASFNYFEGELAPKNRIDTGSFLISWSGTPGTSFGAFIWDRGVAALNQHINKCEIFGDELNHEYLRLAITSRMEHLISKAQGGVGLKHVTKGTLNSTTFGLPPLAEQKRIVAKVDILMAPMR